VEAEARGEGGRVVRRGRRRRGGGRRGVGHARRGRRWLGFRERGGGWIGGWGTGLGKVLALRLRGERDGMVAWAIRKERGFFGTSRALPHVKISLEYSAWDVLQRRPSASCGISSYYQSIRSAI
jgi:hypothetical protein